MTGKSEPQRAYVTVPQGEGCRRTAPPESPAPSSRCIPATFALVYESKDGRLCTFEDADGHLTSVDSSRLA